MPVNFEQLRARRPVQFKDVRIESWGGDARIKRLNAAERLEVVRLLDQYERDDSGQFLSEAEGIEWGVELLARAVIDGQGERVFDSDEGRAMVAAEDFAILGTLIDEAIALNGLGKSDAKAVEAAKKN